MGASSSKARQLPPALDVPDDDAYDVRTMKCVKGREREKEHRGREREREFQFHFEWAIDHRRRKKQKRPLLWTHSLTHKPTTTHKKREQRPSPRRAQHAPRRLDRRAALALLPQRGPVSQIRPPAGAARGGERARGPLLVAAVARRREPPSDWLSRAGLRGRERGGARGDGSRAEGAGGGTFFSRGSGGRCGERRRRRCRRSRSSLSLLRLFHLRRPRHLPEAPQRRRVPSRLLQRRGDPERRRGGGARGAPVRRRRLPLPGGGLFEPSPAAVAAAAETCVVLFF